jgi:outer membrane lipoprotein-sorting protein
MQMKTHQNRSGRSYSHFLSEKYAIRSLRQLVLSPFRNTGLFILLGLTVCFLPVQVSAETVAEEDAREIVEQAFDYWRGMSSVARFSMTIHRPDFQRSMVMKGWTKGRQSSLFFVEKPAKDAGNGTLKKGREMWSYNPKINRVIKLPPSMMSQSWMGSDFSNDDLAKSDSVLDDYLHAVKGRELVAGLTVYTIESMAKESAPVVWGKQELVIREDGVLLKQSFFDEEMILVKEMTAEEIEQFDGRPFPRIWTMRPVEKKDRYTRLEYMELSFGDILDDRLFTLASLKNRRR